MVDTVRTQTDLTTNLFQDGQSAGAITEQDMRDFIVSAFASYTQTKSGSYTLALADTGTVIEQTSGSASNLTVPPNSSVAFAIGTVVDVVQYGAGQVTFVAGAGVTIRTASSLTTRAQYSVASIRKRGTDEWILSGDLT